LHEKWISAILVLETTDMQRIQNYLKKSQSDSSKRLSKYSFSLIAVCSALFLNSCGSAGIYSEPPFIPEPVVEPTLPEPVVPEELEPDLPEEVEPVAPVVPTTPTAKAVPGRPGHVFNPYTQNMVDVDGIPAGTKVRDPQDPDESHTFYVP